MAVTAAELGKLVETVLTAVKKADDGDSAEQVNEPGSTDDQRRSRRR